MSQGELFSAPRSSVPPLPRQPVDGPGRVTYRPISPRHRTLCDDCTDLIHEVGVQEAPFPAPARWRRTADGLHRHLCHAHKYARQEREGGSGR